MQSIALIQSKYFILGVGATFFFLASVIPIQTHASFYGQNAYGSGLYGADSVVDTTPPVITNTTATTSPYTATSTTLSVSTNENAACRYSTTAGSLFSAMTLFNATGGIAHATPVAVVASTTYTYYVKCQDPSANISNDTVITFTVDPSPPADTIPPNVTNTTSSSFPPTTTVVSLTVSTNEVAACRYAVVPGSAFTDMTIFSTTGGISHATSVAVAASSTYTYYVKCQDPSANISADTTIVFSVDPVPADTTPPVVTNTTATTSPSTATSTTLSVSTNEVASCRYSSASGSVFTSMTPFVTTGGTVHRSAVTVMASTSYTYYVKCQDPSANTSADTIVTFTVAPTPSGSTLTQGLLVEYTFEPGTFSGTSVLDVSGNNRTGTVLGGISTTTGKFGDGALFTASSSIDMGTSIFGLTDRYSVSLWINQASFNTNAAANQIFSRGTNTYPFNIHTIASHLVREVTRTSGSYYLNPNGGVTPGSWVNLIVTYDQGVRKFFINGVQLAGDTVPPGLYWQATSHFYLGSLGSTATNGFIGSLDDVRLYNRALTATEATSLANGGS